MPVAFAERVFELDGPGGGSPVTLRLGAPERDPAPGGSWRCRVTIAGLPTVVDRHVYGEDGLQALVLALEMARIYLRTAPLPDGASLTLFGNPDLGIPPMLPGSAVP